MDSSKNNSCTNNIGLTDSYIIKFVIIFDSKLFSRKTEFWIKEDDKFDYVAVSQSNQYTNKRISFVCLFSLFFRGGVGGGKLMYDNEFETGK